MSVKKCGREHEGPTNLHFYKECVNLKTIPAHELAKMLRKFFCEVRTIKDGEEFSRSGLVGIRNAINRYLTSPEIGRIINLTDDREFMHMNQVRKAQLLIHIVVSRADRDMSLWHRHRNTSSLIRRDISRSGVLH